MSDGYECVIREYKNSRYRFYIHRLLAVSEYGIESVKGKDVHHKNNIPWDNRPENIELMTKEKHGRHHSLE